MTAGEYLAAIPDPHDDPVLRPLAAILGRCDKNLAENPIFFTRVLAYAYACSSFVSE